MNASSIRSSGRASAGRFCGLGGLGALLAALLLAPPALAEPTPPTHGIAMHGEPALPPGFPHLPYANPDAPKGGRLVVGVQGTFDSLNPFNVKAGSAAQGIQGNVYQGLMQRSFDEPFTLYGLIAQSIETDATRSFVTFHLDPRAHFSDGKPLTSADVAFSFDLLKTKGRPQQRSAFSLVTAVTTPDD
ncbi:MAG: peptide/nickel transport system substrate-binding protein, partial [Methylobacteriaceae bacterium]|nr:peptide/nickel transport system substrate-binding protein [Methylobacteriaceae bacterium]